MKLGSPGSSSYRPDIDGLRALAVVAVILCHAQAKGFSDGFLGVDVFFVISGYLIHRDLVVRLAARRLSVLSFYGRRLRRTLPALYVAALLSVVASLFVLLPSDLETLARSLLSVLASVPNLFFLSQVGYFDANATTMPLLHTWSLGVEEQFYLAAPLLALALRPLAPRGRAAAMLASFVLAFLFTLVLQHMAPAAAFYLMPARIFEFLLGAVVAEEWLPRLRKRWAAESLSGLALVGLLFSFVAFAGAIPHPGWPTLVPCLATAALIHCGAGGGTRRTVAAALLSMRLPVAVGRISYSLYLYHWPILVLAGYAFLPKTLPWRLGEGVLLAALSVASYRFVEHPFRQPSSIWRQRAPVLLPGGAAVLATCCVLALTLGGLPGRFRPEVDALAAYADYGSRKPFREGQCFITSRDKAEGFDRDTCLALSSAQPNVLLMGDSHAAHLWSGLHATWPGVNFLQATASGCTPVLDAGGERRCATMMREMFDHFIPERQLDAVILSALWSDADVEPLRRTLEALDREGQRAIVFGPLPRYNMPMALLLARAVLHDDFDEVARHRLPETAQLDTRLRAVVAPPATYISTWDAMCPNGICRLFAARDVPMQFDYHHLTAPGVDALMATIALRHPALFDTVARDRLDLSKD